MSQFISFWLWIIILLFLIAIYILMHLHITFHIVYTQTNSVSRVRVGAQALNKIVNIGLKTFYNTGNKGNPDLLINETEKINPIFSMPTISEAITLIHRFKVMHLKRMRCDELKWETQVGVNDPMGTAMLCGSLWGIKYYILGLLSGKLNYSTDPVIHIDPLYNHTHFNTELSCKIKVKVRQALWISIKLVWHLSKSRRKKKQLKHIVRKATPN